MHVWQGAAPAHPRLINTGQLRAAFGKVAMGMPASRLPGLGFDRASAQTLSYLGTMEFFMPKNSGDYDRLDPAIRACLSAADRCGAYVYRLGPVAHKAGLFDFAAHAAPVDEGRVLFLVRNGRVAYKAMGR